jgi:hypothetical protein
MSKKLTLFLLASLVMINFVKAQNWGGGVDDDKLNWGFSFQYIVSEYKLTKKSDWRKPFDEGAAPLTTISSPTSPGFGIGFVVNGNLLPNLDGRFTPTLVFNDRIIKYTYGPPQNYDLSTPMVKKKVSVTMVDFPVGIKLKSDRLLNFRAYMLGGLKYSIDLASSKKGEEEDALEKLTNKKRFLSYEAGLGFDIYFEYFKMSPEVKLSYSFKDVLKHDMNPYANPIEKAQLRHFTFSLFFE